MRYSALVELMLRPNAAVDILSGLVVQITIIRQVLGLAQAGRLQVGLLICSYLEMPPKDEQVKVVHTSQSVSQPAKNKKQQQKGTFPKLCTSIGHNLYTTAHPKNLFYLPSRPSYQAAWRARAERPDTPQDAAGLASTAGRDRPGSI